METAGRPEPVAPSPDWVDKRALEEDAYDTRLTFRPLVETKTFTTDVLKLTYVPAGA